MSITTRAWRLAPGLTLHYRSWDGEHAVFNNLSGDTHLLGSPAIHILETLRHTSAQQDALAASLAHAFDVPHDSELDDDVADLLSSLRNLHLIEVA